MRIIVVDDANTEQADVTTAVQITYDALHASMDYGSGFLGTEELGAMCLLGQAAGFEEWEDVIRTRWSALRQADYSSLYAKWVQQGRPQGRAPEWPDYKKHATDHEKRFILAEFQAAVEEAQSA